MPSDNRTNLANAGGGGGRGGGVRPTTWLNWVAQALLGIVVVWFLWGRVAQDLGEFRSVGLQLQFRPVPIAMAAVVVWVTYGLLIAAWRAILGGWNQQLSFRSSVWIWCVSNLGRYLPGKIWSLAGLAVLATREGVQGWSAAGSALVMQAMAIATGAAVAFAFLPQADSPLPLVAGFAIAAITVAALMAKPVVRQISRLAGKTVELEALPPRTILLATGVTLASWLMYGTAFWLLARGITPDVVPPLTLAVGSFAAAYIVGLLAVFAPGGLIVREGVLMALLAPSVGTGPALALSIGSRLLLTATEVVAALVALMMRPRAGESA